MSETRQARTLRLEREADAMKARSAATDNLLTDHQEAFRRGYNAGIAITDTNNRERARKKPPFSSVDLRRTWRAGFDLGCKGIAAKLGEGAFLKNILPPCDEE